MLEHRGIRRMPFVWFWPDGAEGCVMMTHDVESTAGRAFCGELMDLDDSFEIASAFQLVPEAESFEGLWGAIRSKGFEVNLHDLNHDGTLFQNKREFMRRAAKINRYAREFQCQGFRSGGMYREQTWYDAFEFDYDMSVPSAAHLEPQRGGCCTTMPYFIGDILELPLTTTQDYSLFHILGELLHNALEGRGRVHPRSERTRQFHHPPRLSHRKARARDLCRAVAPPQRASRRKEHLVCRSGRREPLVARSASDDAGCRGRLLARCRARERTRASGVCGTRR